jgi:hypothetical protein
MRKDVTAWPANVAKTRHPPYRRPGKTGLTLSIDKRRTSSNNIWIQETSLPLVMRGQATVCLDKAGNPTAAQTLRPGFHGHDR